MITRVCKYCGYVGPLSDFVKLSHKCKKCQSEYNKAYSAQWRKDNKEKIKALL